MVQILPQEPSLGTALGRSLGSGLSQGIQQGSQVGFQRNLLQNALKGLEGLNPNATPFEQAKALISATAGLPEQGRVLQALTPYIQQQLQSQEQAKTQVSPSQPTLGEPASSQQYNLPIQLPQPQASLGTGFEHLGIGIGEIPATYSPQQYSQVEQQYRASGLDPTPAINRMRREDAIAKERFADIEKGAEREAEFIDYLRKSLPNRDEATYAIAQRIGLSPELRNIKNDALRADAVRKRLQIYESNLQNFRTAAERYNFDQSQYDLTEKNLQRYAKPIIEAGQRDLLEKELADNDRGPVERERVLNPLEPSVEKGFSTLPMIENPLKDVKALPDTPAFDAQFDKAYEKKQKNLKRYEDYIASHFKTGSYDIGNAVNPGTSLLLLRDQAMKKGVNFREFETMINNLREQGKIKLDSYQEKEAPLLSQHPIRSLGVGELLWRLIPGYINRQ